MTDPSKKIYLVIPKLIEQSTWGGSYILNFKKWSKRVPFQNKKIGQSYELYSGSHLRGDLDSSADASFTGELGEAAEPDRVDYAGITDQVISLADLIATDPVGILGKTAAVKHEGQMKILIKFTQARGNSFQMHVKAKDANQRWQAKPESWYYFENGCLTLGIKDPSAWPAYEKACRDIDARLRELTALVQAGDKSLTQARREITALIKDINPWKYVNIINAKKDEIIDLSAGGLHHSWEKDVINHPHGNIVYELCLDVMDPESSIRSFDKGNIKDDGTAREVHLDSYFQLIDRDEKNNDPASHRLQPQIIHYDKASKLESLIRSSTYSLDKITLAAGANGLTVTLDGSYHHLFAKKGAVTISSGESKLTLAKGHSCFIPAAVDTYSLQPQGRGACELLKTFVS